MRKMLLMALTVWSVALLSTLLMPAVSAQPEETLRSEVYIELNWDWVGFGGTSPWTWIGTVSGDVNGDLYVSLTDAWFPGTTEKFSELWFIVTDDGDMAGYDVGTWSFVNWKWVANGKVTNANGDWSYLAGYDMHYRGTTTNPDVLPPTLLSGTGAMILSSH